MAPLRSFLRSEEVAGSFRKDGLLWKHLKNLRFAAPEGESGEAVTRGAVVKKKRRSGTCGNERRKSQLAKGLYKPGDRHHKRLHRGVDYTERRNEEQRRRPARKQQSKEPARRKRQAARQDH